MLNFSRIILITFLAFASQAFAWPGDNGGRNHDRQYYDKACFYEHANFSGAVLCLYPGEQIRNLDGFFNDQISSISIDGYARVTVYKDARFSGAAITIDRDLSNLANYDSLFEKWNDKISSIRVD